LPPSFPGFPADPAVPAYPTFPALPTLPIPTAETILILGEISADVNVAGAKNVMEPAVAIPANSALCEMPNAILNYSR
jgi:hypothetical protein